jgi:hypothetical protein
LGSITSALRSILVIYLLGRHRPTPSRQYTIEEEDEEEEKDVKEGALKRKKKVHEPSNQKKEKKEITSNVQLIT